MSVLRQTNLGACMRTVVALVVALLVSAPAFAQVSGASLSGTVSDQSGAVIPGSRVTIKNLATGITRDITADSAGFYTAPNLLPGTYEVSVSATGFATEVRSGITLTVGAQQVLNVSMQVGQVTEKVQVTGEAPAVQLANSTLSAVVGANTVVELPLNGRSWTDLAKLQPGVAAVVTQVPYTDAGRGNRGYGAQLSVSGGRPQQNNYRLDGVSINDYANGGPGSVLGGNLGVDAVQEFSVLTSNYSAEYGKTSGGVVNAVSKSGTNQYHGNAYWFLRDEDFDARNFFDVPNRLPFHRNQFGASGGGPIKKDRTFFFADYEGIRQAKGFSLFDVVPSFAARAGLLCSACAPAQQNQLKPNPLDPNGTDSNGVDLNIKKYLGLLPLPNGATLGNGDIATFTLGVQRAVTENYFSTRVDHKFSDKDSLFGTYMFDKAPFTTPDLFNDVQIKAVTKRQILALEENHIFSPTLVNTIRLGYNRDLVNNNQPVKAINPLAGDKSLGTVPGQYAPAVQLPEGITQFQGGLNGITTTLFRWNAYQVYDDAFLTKGLHSLKFGFGFERDQNNETTITEQTGTYGFGSMVAFLTNQPTKLRAALPGILTPRGLRQSIVGGYLQDDWRIRPRLTLNLGLRYEMSTVPTDVQGRLTSLYNLTDPRPHCGVAVPGKCVGTGALFSNPTLRNFEPRLGFAWDPTGSGKTAVRGGFGVFDSLPMLYQLITLIGRAYPFFEIRTSNNLPPFSFPSVGFSSLKPGQVEMASVEPNPHRNYVMQWNVNIQHELAQNLTATIGYIGSRSVHQPFRVDEADVVIPARTAAGYLWPNPNCGGPNPSPLCVKINPNVGSIRYLNWGGSASYHALQMGLAKRLTHGLQLQGSYTWGKSIDTGSSVIAGDGFTNAISSMNWFDLKLTRALSDFNVGRTLVLNGTWLLPTLKSASGPLAMVVNGWELGGIFKANDGVPFSALFGTGGDPMGTLSSDDYSYPNRLTGCNPINTNFRKSPSGVPLYVNAGQGAGIPNCFAVATAPSLAFYNANCDPTYGNSALLQCFNLRGNSGRNIMVGPGVANFDFSIFKNTPIKRISENFNVQLRAEFFNILNRANFGPPDLPSGNDDIFDATGAHNGAAGLLTTTTTDPREIQFAVKLIW
jgi:hypothetical protein